MNPKPTPKTPRSVSRPRYLHEDLPRWVDWLLMMIAMGAILFGFYTLTFVIYRSR